MKTNREIVLSINLPSIVVGDETLEPHYILRDSGQWQRTCSSPHYKLRMRFKEKAEADLWLSINGVPDGHSIEDVSFGFISVEYHNDGQMMQ